MAARFGDEKDCRDEGYEEGEARTIPQPEWEELNAAVALVDSDRPAAIEAMRRMSGLLIPDSYLSYLLLDTIKPPAAHQVRFRAQSSLSEHMCRHSVAQPREKGRQEPVALIETGGVAAIDAMREVSGLVTLDSYLSYLLLDATQLDEARQAIYRAHHSLPGPMCTHCIYFGDEGKPTSPIAWALRTLRVALTVADPNEPTRNLACSPFRDHPKEAAWAFGPMAGSTHAELTGGNMKLHCTERLLNQVEPGIERLVMGALRDVSNARMRAQPWPARDSTWYMQLDNAIEGFLLDAIVAPEATQRCDPTSAEANLLALAGSSPSRANRIDEFKRNTKPHLWAVGKGICAVLRARGKMTKLEQCHELATDAAQRALDVWLREFWSD